MNRAASLLESGEQIASVDKARKRWRRIIALYGENGLGYVVIRLIGGSTGRVALT